MTLVLTAPQRIALMCYDCHSSIKNAFYRYKAKIDYSERPCWIVTHETGDYPTFASEDEEPQETYRLEYIGQAFTLDCAIENEELARQVYASSVAYFLSHTQMQFTNDRHNSSLAKLPFLPGVKSIRPQVNTTIGLMNKLGNNELFWGFVLNLIVTEGYDYEEPIVWEEID